MSCSTEETDNYYINGKEEYPSFFSFFYLFLYTRFRKSADHLNEQKLNYSCNYLGWSGKLERQLSERTPYIVAGDERGVGLVRARIAHVHGRHESEPGTRRRERSRNAGRRLGVCAVNGARRGGNGGSLVLVRFAFRLNSVPR